jgi:hypothetical protein
MQCAGEEVYDQRAEPRNMLAHSSFSGGSHACELVPRL